MGVVALDPTLFTEEILMRYIEMPGEVISLTGIGDVETTQIYCAVLNTLEVDDYKNGHMLDNNTIVMSSEDVPCYLDDLAIAIIELTGVSEIPLEVVNSINPLDQEYNSIMGGLAGEEEENEFDADDIIGEYLAECFQRSIKVLTGKTSDVAANKFEV